MSDSPSESTGTKCEQWTCKRCGLVKLMERDAPRCQDCESERAAARRVMLSDIDLMHNAFRLLRTHHRNTESLDTMARAVIASYEAEQRIFSALYSLSQP